MKSLESLKNKVQEDYKSRFDFDKYQVSANDKDVIIQNEAIIFRNFRAMSESLYKVCKALYENSLKLKADGSFMEWYGGIGLSKDKVSELLRRYELYMHFNDKKEWVTSLSVRAIKMLSNNELDIKILYDLAELQLNKTEEIKIFLDARMNENKENIIEIEENGNYKVNPLVQKETKKCVNYKNFEKLEKNIKKMDAKQIMQTEREIESLENYLKSLKKSLADRNKSFENKKNLTLVINDGTVK